MAIVRVRQHVNPLSEKYQQPPEPPAWEKVFANLAQPLHLDIGCGRGQFLLMLAQQQPDWNFLGLEIREPLVVQATQWRDELALPNLHYIFCNVNNFLQPLLASLPSASLQRVTIQFPDPWFKKRHQKRRVVQLEVIETLADFMPPQGMVLLQSDVQPVALEMRERFLACPRFVPQGSWLESNPLPVPTEREQSTLSRGEPVYRAVFLRADAK
ncbi:MAG: tRNA (guanosine(46)-N7)-methyltransferase TrmB [Pegethrix bostrychoides GSE-TBD4-15B]|uniref:tRNA (guanine-N(7)-)-methyltransferase n=1 Tax=Pegethrix bostrychoides GSE-TBD4-15B TaxID=2839662 RepID=A0A951PFT3_9CYAN|nr:tRNA (guanosine(46)-N7)-methyltransferase TrmB [Pegethrix bostrychoides GSE-TBD4-15B]